MAETIVRDNRLAWIDWMKALGIYLIVLGHFYSVGEKFIYVFHVPLPGAHSENLPVPVGHEFLRHHDEHRHISALLRILFHLVLKV